MIERALNFFRGEKRKAPDVSWQALASYSGSNVSVNARTAEQVAAVLAAVNAISSAIAALPAYVYRRSENGREIDTAHPIAQLIRNGPNPRQSWCDFMEWLTAETLLHGNGVAEIITDGRGAVVELNPIPWGRVSVQLIRERLVFETSDDRGQTRRLLQGEALHLKDRTDDGIVGRPRLARAAPVIQTALELQTFGLAFYQNGARPSGILKTSSRLKPEEADRLQRRWDQAMGGSDNVAKTAVLPGEIEYTKLGIDPENAEFISARRFGVEEIARVFGTPPPLIQDYTNNTFTNAAQAARWFAQNTLQPWLAKIESEFMRSVFTAEGRRTHELEIDMSGFLRGDAETRWKNHEIAVENEILTVDEIREIEGFPPQRRDTAGNR